MKKQRGDNVIFLGTAKYRQMSMIPYYIGFISRIDRRDYETRNSLKQMLRLYLQEELRQ